MTFTVLYSKLYCKKINFFFYILNTVLRPVQKTTSRLKLK